MAHPALPLRFLILLLAASALAGAQGQQLAGRIQGAAVDGRMLLLSVTEGAEQRAVDSVRVRANGRFDFRTEHWPTGFYQLALSDTDRVDIILDDREPQVHVQFTGLPLQEHITVVRSPENMRLWRYKHASREAQRALAEIREQRAATAPLDGPRLQELAAREAAVEANRRAVLDSIISVDSTGFFARVVQADRRLMAAVALGADHVARSFDWADPAMVRTTIYPKAVMAYLQKTPFDAPGGLMAAVDSLMAWSAGDTTTWRYTRYLVTRLFHEYGPEEVADHVVDRYIAGKEVLLPAEQRLRDLVAERLRAAVGAHAPEVLLPDTGGVQEIRLQDVLAGQRYTLLFFYSSSCDHCHHQMPGLRALYAATDRNDLAVLGIALDADKDEMRHTIATEGLPWPTYSALKGWGCPVAKAFGIRATPTFVLLDANGTIVARPPDHEVLTAVLAQRLR